MTAGAAHVAAQAKINLRLRVLAREASGYHQVETLLMRLDLADSLTVRAGAGQARSIDVIGSEALDAIGPAEENLAYRAAVAYAEHAGWPRGFSIELEKRIPIGAGLGGGSADAAAVLRALNALAPRPLPEPSLLDIAAALGADVPFLTWEAPFALAWGRGDRMLRLPELPAAHVLLVSPPFGVRTRDAYDWLDAGDGASTRRGAVALEPASLASWTRVAMLARNDFEREVFARHPALADARRALEAHGARIARLSGSGATVFGIFEAPPISPLALAGGHASWRIMHARTADRVVAVDRID